LRSRLGKSILSRARKQADAYDGQRVLTAVTEHDAALIIRIFTLADSGLIRASSNCRQSAEINQIADILRGVDKVSQNIHLSFSTTYPPAPPYPPTRCALLQAGESLCPHRR
jgi:hypothetical protein